MRQTGIVSCYFKHNYGSMLQAYATQMALDKLGIENETINISGISKNIKLSKMIYFAKMSLTSDILFQKKGMLFNKFKKKLNRSEYAELSKVRDEEFNLFEKEKFRLSPAYKSKNELSDSCGRKYDCILVGSDQLWLPANIAGDYYTLNFVPKTVNSISYSTSFGMENLPKDIKNKAAFFLNKIRHISVREESGQRIVYELTGRKVPIVCDPTLLLDENEWIELIKDEKEKPNDKYILCYFLGKNEYARRFAERLKEITGYKIISIAHMDEYIKMDDIYSDEIPYNTNPMDFLNLIKNAEYVCTDSFHCSVFSMHFRKIFFAFRRYTKNTKQSTNNRLDNLFNLVKIDNRIQEGNNTVEEALKYKIDYENVHRNLDELRKVSFEYLKKAIFDNGSTDL